jgi:hypothetical protein
LIGSDNSFVKFGNLAAIIDLFLGVEVDGAVVYSELILSKKGYGSLLQVQMYYLIEDFCTVNLFLFDFYPLIELSDPIYLFGFTHEGVEDALAFLDSG